ncbi:MAG: hypothetical protein IKG32_07840 [Clostridia bacterium]|nr:hypothetical protein [Clostridia bacterium]
MTKAKTGIMACILMAVLLLSTLTACVPAISAIPVLTAGEAEASPAPVVDVPYKDDGSRYVYRYAAGTRDRAWEEDIVFLTNRFLDPWGTGHPKLVKQGCSLHYLKDLRAGYEDYENKYESLYEPALREEFVRHINELLLSIGEKSDDELLFGCAQAAAVLHDGHTGLIASILDTAREAFPLGLCPLYADGVPGAYIYAVPKGREDLLLCRLDAINGVPLSEILDDVCTLFSHEHIAWAQYIAFHYTSPRCCPSLLNVAILRYFGIMGEEKTAILSLTDETGAIRQVEMAYFTQKSMPKLIAYWPAAVPNESVDIRLTDSYWEEDVWYELIDEGQALYIRLRQCASEADKTVLKAVTAAKQAGGVKKVILDFRGNSGGSILTAVDIIRQINALDAPDGKYVLIDGGAFSAAVLIPVGLKRFCPDVVLVGEPAGMPPNGAFGSCTFTTPNMHLSVTMAIRDCYYCWPENDDPTLMPDVLVHQTLEDYWNGIDTVLAYVLSDSAQ